jgi:V/A-type H+-transporting ATPase subunit D
MREVAPTRSAAIELADERKLMRQGYDFLDEKRMLLATEMLRRLRDYEALTKQLDAETKAAAEALAAAVERHGLDQLQIYPAPEARLDIQTDRALLLGIALLSVREPADQVERDVDAIDTSPEAKACRAAFERLLMITAEVGVRAGNLQRLAREYKRTERRAKALEKVLLPEVEEAIKRVDEQLDTLERDEIIRTRWSRRTVPGEA